MLNHGAVDPKIDNSGQPSSEINAVTAKESGIQLTDVWHAYASRGGLDTPVVAGIDLAIEPGQFVAVVGPSGCGKTTLLSMVSGMLIPQRGDVSFGGQRVHSTNRRIAYMLANDALLPWRSALRNVELGLEGRGLPRNERHREAALWLERVGLGEYQQAHVHGLSQGMRQRVAIARTLAQRPSCILMDEPFSALDAQTRVFVHKAFLSQWDLDKPTVILITHDLSEAVLLADRVLLMSKRPTRLIADIQIPFNRPRNLEELKRNSQFQEIEAALWEQLRLESLDIPE